MNVSKGVSSARVGGPKPRDWSDEVIYFPLTDRFCDGNPDNNQGVDQFDPLAFHGGDLAGIQQKLSAIQNTGSSTLWLAPVQKNTPLGVIGDYRSAGYHGYWIQDHEQVDPHQGTLTEAKELVEEAHSRGMRVVLDTVLNHTGPDHPWLRDPAKSEWFHHNGSIQDYNDHYQVERCDLGGLPDLNQENPEVYEYLLHNTAYWVKELNADGVRLDAVKHISKDFWKKFVPDLKAELKNPELFVVGEVLQGDVGYVADYQRSGIDHVFDIPMYYTIREVLGNDAPCYELAKRFGEDWKYSDPSKLVTLLDNHDFPRFMSTSQGSEELRVQRLKVALDLLMTMRGIPSLYYGTESAMEGNGDPDNRRQMEFDRHPEVQSHVRQLADLRQANEPLRRGQQLEIWVDPKVYAFARRTSDQENIVVINNDDQSSHRDIPLRVGSPLEEGQWLEDALSKRQFRIENGHLHVDLAARSALILVPVTQ